MARYETFDQDTDRLQRENGFNEEGEVEARSDILELSKMPWVYTSYDRRPAVKEASGSTALCAKAMERVALSESGRRR